MLWVFTRIASMRQFLWVPITSILKKGIRKVILCLSLIFINYLELWKLVRILLTLANILLFYGPTNRKFDTNMFNNENKIMPEKDKISFEIQEQKQSIFYKTNTNESKHLNKRQTCFMRQNRDLGDSR